MTPARRPDPLPCPTAVALATLAAGLLAAGLALAADPPHPPAAGTWWLGYADNPGEQRRLAIHLDAALAVNVRVQAPALSVDVRTRVEPGSTSVIDIPIEALTLPGPPVPHGLRVSIDGPADAAAGLSVRGLNRRPNSSDAFLALPEAVLGSRYRLLGYTGLRGAPTSQALVVATRDDTTVTIEATPGCPAAKVRLAAGQAWLHACTDVSGARLEASAPVAVFGGARCAEVPDGAEFCSHLVEQLPPVEHWGRSFVALPSSGRKASDRLRILAAVDGTEVRLDGAPIATLAAGRFHEQVLARPALIEGSAPLLVAQYAAGSSVDQTEGDPFMALVPATSQYSRLALVGMPVLPANPDAPDDGPAFTRHQLSLVVPAAAAGNLRVDGAAVAASAFTAIGDGRWKVALLPVSPGPHRVEAAEAFGSLLHGYGLNDSYGLPGALFLAPPASGDPPR